MIQLTTRTAEKGDRMDTDSNPEIQQGQKRRGAAIWKLGFLVVLAVLIFLLAQSMVNHRFFRGERVHRNGSIGQ
jgi:hypothetical protein